MPSRQLVVRSQESPERAVERAIIEFVTRIPASRVTLHGQPDEEVRRLTSTAAAKAAVTAGSLALPPGPLGWLTLLPEMVGVWRIQAQLVADIARVHGRSADLRREHMLVCLFRHSAAQAVRDLAVRSGGRLLVREASVTAIQRAARAIGLRLTQRGIASAVSRWLPVVGAVGIGGYAYWDTAQVGKTAQALFAALPAGGKEAV